VNELDAPAFEMLRPTLERGAGAFHCVVLDDHIAVLFIAPPPHADEMLISVRLHARLNRGLLVVL
jgi:hypothetical protein